MSITPSGFALSTPPPSSSAAPRARHAARPGARGTGDRRCGAGAASRFCVARGAGGTQPPLPLPFLPL
eukprot:357243-Chlamydomonas_euryale.AAC.2